jgi:hypothetical protein
VGGCSWAETGQQIGDPRLDVPALNPEVGRQLVFLEECYELPQRLGVGLDGAPSLVLGLEVQDPGGLKLSKAPEEGRRLGLCRQLYGLRALCWQALSSANRVPLVRGCACRGGIRTPDLLIRSRLRSIQACL